MAVSLDGTVHAQCVSERLATLADDGCRRLDVCRTPVLRFEHMFGIGNIGMGEVGMGSR